MRTTHRRRVDTAIGWLTVHRCVAAVVTCGILAGTGCESPIPKYTPPDDSDTVSVTAEDLGVPAEAVMARGMRRLDAHASFDRFPTGVSVVRVEAGMSEKETRRFLQVADMPTESAVYWTHLWDNLPPIREVTPLRTLGLDPRGADHEDLLRESVKINCDLCLMYGLVDDTDADAEFVAVLWDAATRKALVTFRAPVTLTEEELEESERFHRGGKWVSEAEFRAEADLRKQIRDAMWDMASESRPPATTQPSPWREYLPVFPRDYDRFRRIDEMMRRKS